jgi:hypothetical protein
MQWLNLIFGRVDGAKEFRRVRYAQLLRHSQRDPNALRAPNIRNRPLHIQRSPRIRKAHRRASRYRPRLCHLAFGASLSLPRVPTFSRMRPQGRLSWRPLPFATRHVVQRGLVVPREFDRCIVPRPARQRTDGPRW